MEEREMQTMPMNPHKPPRRFLLPQTAFQAAVLQGAVLHAVVLLCAPAVHATGTVSFDRQIKPLLAQYCYDCHGPDANKREAGFRLDTQAGAFAALSDNGRAFVAGQPAHSQAYTRMTSSDENLRMPPPSSRRTMKPSETAIIRKWIQQGARFADHWAFVAPVRPRLPELRDSQWSSNAIDHFTLAQMQQHSLTPATVAPAATQLRRLSLGLTGIAPSPAELDAFSASQQPDRYAREVERLLASPRYGEHLAAMWLDLARYADTHGYHTDSHRDMWPWRDWVINAFNKNMPYNRFTIEQLAGDLLPGATVSQKIATGFNRNHMINFENGALAEEYRTEYVMDRTVTTATTWLGLTMRCARCHDHKYDPLTQRDFYSLFAYFNNVPENGIDGQAGNAKPVLRAPTPSQQLQLTWLRQKLKSVTAQMKSRERASLNDQIAWEKKLQAGAVFQKPPGGMLHHFALDEVPQRIAPDLTGKPAGVIQGDGFHLPGRRGDALLMTGDTHVEAAAAGVFQTTSAFTIAAWVQPTVASTMTVVSRRSDATPEAGYELLLRGRRLTATLVHAAPGYALEVHTKKQLPTNVWSHVAMTYDGSSKAAGVNLYVNGEAQECVTSADNLSGNILTASPFQIGRRGAGTPFRGMLDDIRIYPRRLTAGEVGLVAGGDPVREIVAVKPAARTAAQRKYLRRFYLENIDAAFRKSLSQYQQLQSEVKAVQRRVPTVMVMQELPQPRTTLLLESGDYRSGKKAVTPGVPAALPPLPPGSAANRLSLAQWMVSRNNPLTARVMVNRLWQMLFGAGLVRTSEDFGVRGARPTHPQLLDWLAVEFMESGWDIKHILRLMVSSSTFRQSSAASRQQWAADPENRWLARGPRRRLSPAAIRDNALAAAGVLQNTMGGRGVSPYQPPGLWKEISYNPLNYTAQVFKQSHGADLYRRSVYTFWKRASPPPAMATLGAAPREVCTVQTETPATALQAIVLLNETGFTEAARIMAAKILTAPQLATGDTARLRYAFRLAVSRLPGPQELALLQQQLAAYRVHFADNKQAAAKLLAVGEHPSHRLPTSEHAAWTVIASLLLNLDEAITSG